MSKIDPFAVTDKDVSHVVIELFGGDNNLSLYVRRDLSEIKAGNRGRFAVIALADYARSGGRVLELSPGKDLRVVEELGEIDTGDPETLATFIARALVTYQATPHRALGFWDHGSGVFDETDAHEIILNREWRGVVKRPRLFIPKASIVADASIRAMLHDETSGGLLTNVEASGVVRTAFDRAGVDGKLDLIFSDTCLNGMIEVLDQLQPFADVIVGSEELEPGDGWDYERLFSAMSDAPPQTPEAWGIDTVDAFEGGYRHRPSQFPCTLAAFRTENAMVDRFAELVVAAVPLGRDGFRMLSGIRGESQPFGRRDSYDIRDFATRVSAEASGALKHAADGLVAAFDAACIRSVALGDDVKQAHGLAFWFPSDGRLFRDTAGTYRKLEFDRAVHWADYLATYLA